MLPRPLLTLLLLLSLTRLPAQQVQWNARLGAHQGRATITDKKTGEKTNTSGLTGFQASIGLKAEFENRLYFAPRLQYSTNGFLKKGSPGNPDSSFRFHHLELPLLLHLHLGNQAGRGLFTEFGLVLAGSFRGTATSNGKTTPLKFSMTQYNPVNVNAMGNLGYRFPNGIFLDAVFTYGLTSITNGDTKPKIRTLQAGLGLGYYFKKGKS